jgi:hypothetical protein
MLRLLAGKKDQGKDLAGKSTLNRLELGTGRASRYKKINFWRDAVDELLVDLCVESFQDATRKAASFMVTTVTTAICRCTS